MKPISKVFILTNTLKNGGAEKQSVMLANALKDNFATSLIVYYGNEYDQKLKELAETYSLNVIWLSGSHVRKLMHLFLLFSKNRNSAIFSYLATTNVINGILGFLAGVKLRIGGIRNAQLSPIKLKIQRLVHNRFLNYSIFNNYRGKEVLCKRGYNPKKAIVIPNCIEVHESIKDRVIDENSIINIVTIGRFVAQKDYSTALEAIDLLRQKLDSSQLNMRFKYLIIGYGELESEIRNVIAMKKLGDQVELIINPPIATEYLKNAHIYLSTSLFEGLSNSIMEAMEHSLPVVATDVGDNNQLISEGENGFLTTIRNPHEISEKIFHLISNYHQINEMGRNGFQKLIESYSFSIFKRRYVELLTK